MATINNVSTVPGYSSNLGSKSNQSQSSTEQFLNYVEMQKATDTQQQAAASNEQSGFFGNLFGGLFSQSLTSSETETAGQQSAAASPPSEESTLSSMQGSLLEALQSSFFGSSQTPASSENSAANQVASQNARTSSPSGAVNFAPKQSPGQQHLTAASPQQAQEPESGFIGNFLSSSFGDNGFDVKDGFDAINTLNHIPLVSDIYQNATSDDVSAFSSVTGGYLYAGLPGVAYELANLTTKAYTGSSITKNIWDLGKSALSLLDDLMPDAKTLSKPLEMLSGGDS